ncbi:methyltransferase [Alloacidobacterium dinghuense]|uniref:Methyltransferase n=2 Tax=Alloacidobacterium dinghuense TaxID=2763107 RepID=A0A7G8BRA9_9BACT|nr:methyltransferase [Alloacidobacterium dinghuense]
MQIGLGFWASKVLLSAVEMGVFTELAHGPEQFDNLAGRLGLHHRSSRDYLDALVALGFLQRSNGVYSNTPETDLFLDRNKPGYLGGILEMANARLYGFWNHLTEALRTGRPQNEARDNSGESPFGALYADPARLKSFLAAMSGISHGANVAIANKVPWANYKTFADVGTAQGDLAVQIALANPHLKGIGFDLAQVGPTFEEYAEANGVHDRLTFQPGDFFTEVLPKVDVITMGHILHDWDLEEKKMLIGKAYDALNPGGALVVYDAIIDDDRSRNAFGLLMSLNMLIETSGGFDYTGAECIEWMKAAGFRDAYVEHLVGPDSMVVGFK